MHNSPTPPWSKRMFLDAQDDHRFDFFSKPGRLWCKPAINCETFQLIWYVTTHLHKSFVKEPSWTSQHMKGLVSVVRWDLGTRECETGRFFFKYKILFRKIYFNLSKHDYLFEFFNIVADKRKGCVTPACITLPFEPVHILITNFRVRTNE